MSLHQKFSFSFEVFPPKTKKGLNDLNQTRRKLSQLTPYYYSRTGGAEGSVQLKSVEVVLLFVHDGMAVTPNISCVNRTTLRLQALLREYQQLGIK